MPAILAVIALVVQAVLAVRTELVIVPVSVTDGQGNHVAGLRGEQFRVFVDGREQPVVLFDDADASLTLGILLDRSQSMRSKNSIADVAMSFLLQSSRPTDELFGVGFNDDVSLALAPPAPFTSDAHALQTSMRASSTPSVSPRIVAANMGPFTGSRSR